MLGTSEPDAAAPPEPEEEADLYPVTAAQRRLWFLDRLEPGLAAYNLVAAIELRGPLDPARLRAAAAAAVRRHDALRTFFAELDGELWQVVLPRLEPPLPAVDLGGLDAARREEETARAVRAEAAVAFDLERPPLFRLRLLRRSAVEHALLVTIHHGIADGPSLRVLARDLASLYAGSLLPPRAAIAQLSSFAAWQARARTPEALAPGLAYWRRRLAGAPSLQQLPTDRRRPRRPSFRGAVERLAVPAAPAAALAEIGRREAATPFMTRLATFLALLHRWSWRTDLLAATPVTNRDRPELAEAVGFFVDVVLLRVGVDGGEAFPELLRRTREAVLDALAHQDVPLDLLVDELGVERRLDHQPFLQVLFGLSEAGEPALRAAGIEVELADLEDADGGAKADLSLVFHGTEEGLVAWLRYAADLYDGVTIRRLLSGYGHLLAGLAADPGRPLAELPMIGEGERQQVLREWSGAHRPAPPGRPVHEVFRRRAERSPGAPALDFPEAEVSYGELEARANRLARALAGRGAGGESPVGICLEPSVDFVAAVLAVLKAGGAYLPLDPGLPPPRLAAMIAAAGARLVVTRSEAAAGLPGGACELFFLDRERERIAAAGADAFAAPCEPDSLAYIVFTSGSTGAAKGVAVPHRAIHRLVVGGDFLQLGEGDRVALASNPGFDASTLEIWGALLNGGCLVLLPRELLLAPGELFARLAAKRVTTLWLTKSLFDALVRHDLRHDLRQDSGGFAGLANLLTGGEALDPDVTRTALARLAPGGPSGGPRLLNGYGPTENTTFTAVHRIEAVPERAHGVPIGRPIRGTHVYLLDRGLRPVPAGVAGELYTGGEGLARGYVAEPALTAAAFLPDPFAEVPGARLYRTGDLARWRGDGVLEFLGRADRQVKIHGFRIEPAEIEAELARHPGVRAAAVVAREDEPGDRRLVAYVVPAAAAGADLAGVRAFLAERLPSFLVPHAFVALAELPLNASGKLDRAALPPPGLAGEAGAAPPAAPRTPLERTLAEVWREVLRRPEIGVHDNFFQIGGDSILSIRLVARARERGLDLSPGLLFEAQTIAGLAAALAAGNPAAAAAAEPDWSPLVVLQAGAPGRPAFFCVHPLAGNVIAFLELASALGPDLPFFALQAPGAEGGREPLDRMEEIATLYVDAVRRRQPRGPYRLGGYSFGGVVAFEMARQMAEQGDEIALLAILDTPAPPPPPETPAAGEREEDDDLFWLGRIVHMRERFLDVDLGLARERLAELGEEERLRRVAEALARAGVLPGDAGAELMRRLVRVSRAQYRAYARYRPGAYAGRITLLRSRELHPEEASEALRRAFRDPAMEWGRLSPLPVRVVPVPGDHVSLLVRPQVETVAAMLREAILSS